MVGTCMSGCCTIVTSRKPSWQVSPTILLNWVILVSEDADLFAQGVTTISWLVFMHWAYLCGLDTNKGTDSVVSDYLCLPASRADIALPSEGQGCAFGNDTNKFLQIMIHSVRHI